MIKDSLIQYYSQRSPQYEEIYRHADPVSRRELAEIEKIVRGDFAGRTVLEIACGTGWWTRLLNDVAYQVVGVDASREMLQLALQKNLSIERVHWIQSNAFGMNFKTDSFTGALANFWLSHVAADNLQNFLTGLHLCLGHSSRVVMVDNVYIPGRGGQLVRSPGEKDTCKVRELPNGSRHQIVKNYFDAEKLHQVFSPLATGLQVLVGKRYWWIRYMTS